MSGVMGRSDRRACAASAPRSLRDSLAVSMVRACVRARSQTPGRGGLLRLPATSAIGDGVTQ